MKSIANKNLLAFLGFYSITSVLSEEIFQIRNKLKVLGLSLSPFIIHNDSKHIHGIDIRILQTISNELNLELSIDLIDTFDQFANKDLK